MTHPLYVPHWVVANQFTMQKPKTAREPRYPIACECQVTITRQSLPTNVLLATHGCLLISVVSTHISRITEQS